MWQIDAISILNCRQCCQYRKNFINTTFSDHLADVFCPWAVLAFIVLENFPGIRENIFFQMINIQNMLTIWIVFLSHVRNPGGSIAQEYKLPTLAVAIFNKHAEQMLSELPGFAQVGNILSCFNTMFQIASSWVHVLLDVIRLEANSQLVLPPR